MNTLNELSETEYEKILFLINKEAARFGINYNFCKTINFKNYITTTLDEFRHETKKFAIEYFSVDEKDQWKIRAKQKHFKNFIFDCCKIQNSLVFCLQRK